MDWPQGRASERETVLQEKRVKPMALLLVDDNPTFLRILKRFLEEQGRGEMAVAGLATGGQEALTTAAALRPDLVLLDLAMPDLHGLEVIPRLRSLLPETGIIALTLMNPESYRQAVLAAGADEFVTKSTLDTDLLPAIRRVSATYRIGAPLEP